MLHILPEARNGALSIGSAAIHLSYIHFSYIKVLVLIITSSLIRLYYSWTWYFCKSITLIIFISSSTSILPSIFYLLYILHLPSQLVNTRIIIVVYGRILLRKCYLGLISFTILTERVEMGKHILFLAFPASLNKLFPIDLCETLWIDGAEIGQVHIAGHQDPFFPPTDGLVTLFSMLGLFCMLHIRSK